MRSMYFIFFLSIFFHLSSTEELPLHPESVISPHKEPLIKVRISQDLPGVYVDIKGHYQAKESISGEPILGGFREKIYHIVHKKEGLAWPHPVPGLNHITLVPDSSLSSLLINGIQYKGIIHIGYTEQRKIEIIEEVDIEHFLQCTLPLVLPSYPLEKETVRALAIVARTEAYYTKNQKQKEILLKLKNLLQIL